MVVGVYALLCGPLLDCAWGSDGKGAVTEYEVKAAFLLNFIRFIEWPDETAGHAGQELFLCIAGKDPFGEALNLIRGKTIRGRTLVIENDDDGSSFSSCHILFLPSSEKERLSSLITAVGDLPVLTVSETEGFVERGGILNFIIVENKIRFEINPDAAKRAGLTISAQLLKLAHIVQE